MLWTDQTWSSSWLYILHQGSATFGEFALPDCSKAIPFFPAKLPAGEARVVLSLLLPCEVPAVTVHLDVTLKKCQVGEGGRGDFWLDLPQLNQAKTAYALCLSTTAWETISLRVANM